MLIKDFVKPVKCFLIALIVIACIKPLAMLAGPVLVNTLQSNEVMTTAASDLITLTPNTLALPSFDGEELRMHNPNTSTAATYGELINYGVIDALGGRLIIGEFQGNNDPVTNSTTADRAVYQNIGLFDCMFRYTKTALGVSTISNLLRQNINYHNLSGCVLLGRNLIQTFRAYQIPSNMIENVPPALFLVMQNAPFRVAVTGSGLCTDYLYCLVLADQIKQNGGSWKSFSLHEDHPTSTIGYTGVVKDASSNNVNLTREFASLPTVTDYQAEITKPQYGFYYPPYWMPYMTRQGSVCVWDTVLTNGSFNGGTSTASQPSCVFRDNFFYLSDFSNNYVSRSEPSHVRPQHFRYLVGLSRYNTTGDEAKINYAIPQHKEFYLGKPARYGEYEPRYYRSVFPTGSEAIDYVEFPGPSTLAFFPHMGAYEKNGFLYYRANFVGVSYTAITPELGGIEQNTTIQNTTFKFKSFFQFGGNREITPNTMGGLANYINNDYDDLASNITKPMTMRVSVIPHTSTGLYRGFPILTGYDNRTATFNFNVLDEDVNGISLNGSLTTLTFSTIQESSQVTFSIALNARPRATVLLKPEISWRLLTNVGSPFAPLVASSSDWGVTLTLSTQTINHYKTYYNGSHSAHSTKTFASDTLQFSPVDWNMPRILVLGALADSTIEFDKQYQIKFNSDLYQPNASQNQLDYQLYHPYGISNATSKSMAPIVSEVRIGVSRNNESVFITPTLDYCQKPTLANRVQSCSVTTVFSEQYNFNWAQQPVDMMAFATTVVNLIEPLSLGQSQQIAMANLTSRLVTDIAFFTASNLSTTLSVTSGATADLTVVFSQLPTGSVVGSTSVLIPPSQSSATFSLSHQVLADTLIEGLETVQVSLLAHRPTNTNMVLSYQINIYDNDLGLFDLNHQVSPPIMIDPYKAESPRWVFENTTQTFNVLSNLDFVPFTVSSTVSSTFNWLMSSTLTEGLGVLFTNTSTLLAPQILGATKTLEISNNGSSIMPDSVLNIFGSTDANITNPTNPSLSYIVQDKDIGQISMTFISATRVLAEIENNVSPLKQSVTAQLTIFPQIAASVTITFEYRNTVGSVLDNTELSVGTVFLTPNQTQTIVTLTGIFDRITDGDQFLSIYGMLSSNEIAQLSNYRVTQSIGSTWTVVDVDWPGVTYTKSVFTEGTTDTLGFGLLLNPIDEVSAVLAFPTQLILPSHTLNGQTAYSFDSTNWSVFQPVSLLFPEDDLMTGNASTTLRFSFSQADATQLYNGMVDNVLLTILDNDIPTRALNVTDTGVAGPDLRLVLENAGSKTINIALSVKPLYPIEVTALVQVPDPNKADAFIFVTNTIVFDSSNWNIPRPLTLVTVDNDFFHGDQGATLQLSFKGQNWTSPIDNTSQNINFVIQDDETITLLMSYLGIDGITHPINDQTFKTIEGVSSLVHVRIGGATPIDPVTVLLSNAPVLEALLSASQLVFDRGNWMATQSVDIFPIKDNVTNPRGKLNFITATLVSGVSTVATNRSFALNIFDAQSIVISPPANVTSTSGTFTNPDGTTVSFAYSTTESVSIPIQFNLSISDNSNYHITSTLPFSVVYPSGGSSLLFTSQNYASPQLVYFTPPTNGFIEPPYLKQIDIGSANSAYPAAASFNVLVVNADVASMQLIPATSVIFENTSVSAVFKLSAPPVHPVTVNLSFVGVAPNASYTILPSIGPSVLVFDSSNWAGQPLQVGAGYRMDNSSHTLLVKAIADSLYMSKILDYHLQTVTHLFEVQNATLSGQLIVDTTHWTTHVFKEGEIASIVFGVTNILPPSLKVLVDFSFDELEMAIVDSSSQVFSGSAAPSITQHSCVFGVVYGQSDRCVATIRFYQDLVVEPLESTSISFRLLAGEGAAPLDIKIVTLTIVNATLNIVLPATPVQKLTITYPNKPATVPIDVIGKEIEWPFGSFVDAQTKSFPSLIDVFKSINPILVEQTNTVLTNLPNQIPASIVYLPDTGVNLLYVSHHLHEGSLSYAFYFDKDNDQYPDFLFNPEKNVIDFVNIHILKLEGVKVTELPLRVSEATRQNGEFYGKIFAEQERFVNSSVSLKLPISYPKILLRSPSNYPMTLYSFVGDAFKPIGSITSTAPCAVRINCSPVEFNFDYQNYQNFPDTGHNVMFATGSRSGVVPFVVNNRTDIKLINTPSRRVVKRGELLTYQVRLTPKSATSVQVFENDWVYEYLPIGLRMLTNSARLVVGSTVQSIGVTQVDATSNLWRFNLTPAQSDKIDIYYQVLVQHKASFGEKKSLTYFSNVQTTQPTAVKDEPIIRVKPDVIFDTSLLLGKVFVDVNRNNIQDEGERGVAGVKIMLEDGREITTDQYGRYHVAQLINGRHVLRLVESSIKNSDLYLPHKNMKLINANASSLQKANFALWENKTRSQKIAKHAFLNVVLLKDVHISFLNQRDLLSPVEFQVVSNFPHLIDRFQIDIFDSSGSIIHSIYGHQDTLFSKHRWNGKDKQGQLIISDEHIYAYRLVAYDKQDRMFYTTSHHFVANKINTFDELRHVKSSLGIVPVDNLVFVNGLVLSDNFNYSDHQLVRVNALDYQFIQVRNTQINEEKVYPIGFLGVLDPEDARSDFYIILPRGKYQIKAFN